MQEAITKSMAVAPEDRYATVGDLVTALDGAPVKGQGLRVPATGGAAKKERKSPWRVVVVVAAVLAGVICLGLVGVGLLT